uniref:Uncharacterized protein n=1 Tax=Marseillevirus LCMAC101 TaxID=2506602 RepID=A0A481YS28_9VIRU|nr:MAG: hypothetical protein LCMAC101_05830 [Marseillevirus LCMAC101]
MTGTGLILLIAVVVIVILCFSRTNDNFKNDLNKMEGMDEDLSYSFGFPTSYNYGYPPYGYGHGYSQYPGYGAWGVPYAYQSQGYGPGTWYTPPGIRRQERRRRTQDRSQWTAPCYDADEDDDCLPGYQNQGNDTDGDGVDDDWECCRRG